MYLLFLINVSAVYIKFKKIIFFNLVNEYRIPEFYSHSYMIIKENSSYSCCQITKTVLSVSPIFSFYHFSKLIATFIIASTNQGNKMVKDTTQCITIKAESIVNEATTIAVDNQLEQVTKATLRQVCIKCKIGFIYFCI